MWRSRASHRPLIGDAAFYDPQHRAPVVKRPRAGAAAAHVFPKRPQSCSRSLQLRLGFPRRTSTEFSEHSRREISRRGLRLGYGRHPAAFTSAEAVSTAHNRLRPLSAPPQQVDAPLFCSRPLRIRGLGLLRRHKHSERHQRVGGPCLQVPKRPVPKSPSQGSISWGCSRYRLKPTKGSAKRPIHGRPGLDGQGSWSFSRLRPRLNVQECASRAKIGARTRSSVPASRSASANRSAAA
jgi:hypothetical protein